MLTRHPGARFLLRSENATSAFYVAQQILTFIAASHRENEDEKNIALRQNQGDAH
jgi:hypothetical protein